MKHICSLVTAFAIFMSLLMVYSASPAYDNNGNLAIWGIGQSSCFGFRKAYDGGEFREYKTYAMGYLTAYNAFTPETYNVTGDTKFDAILAKLSSYCKKTPMESFEKALRQMVIEMSETVRVKQFASPVPRAPLTLGDPGGVKQSSSP